METKILSNATHKCVLVIDNAQPTGIVANIASVLSMTLGCRVSNIVSHDVYDKQGERHLGITQLPIPILGASQDLVLVDFSTIAQQSRTYDEYEREMYSANEDDLHYVGIGICAEKKAINKATGSLSLIR